MSVSQQTMLITCDCGFAGGSERCGLWAWSSQCTLFSTSETRRRGVFTLLPVSCFFFFFPFLGFFRLTHCLSCPPPFAGWQARAEWSSPRPLGSKLNVLTGDHPCTISRWSSQLSRGTSLIVLRDVSDLFHTPIGNSMSVPCFFLFWTAATCWFLCIETWLSLVWPTLRLSISLIIIIITIIISISVSLLDFRRPFWCFCIGHMVEACPQ